MSIVYSQCTVAVLAIYIYLCRFLQIDHLYGLLMDHENKFRHFILLIHIFGRVFILHPILMHLFSLN